jgi:anti-sigma B factor antagonist
MLLQIHEEDLASGIRLVELKGKLAMGRESQRVEALVDDLVADGHLRAIFDVTHVDYIDSAGIGMLALVSGKMRESGGRLAIVAPEGRVLQMLKMTQIINIMNEYATVGEAEATFGSTQSEASASPGS